MAEAGNTTHDEQGGGAVAKQRTRAFELRRVANFRAAFALFALATHHHIPCVVPPCSSLLASLDLSDFSNTHNTCSITMDKTLDEVCADFARNDAPRVLNEAPDYCHPP